MRFLAPKEDEVRDIFMMIGKVTQFLEQFLKFEVLLPNYNIKIILRLCKYCQNDTKTVWEA